MGGYYYYSIGIGYINLSVDKCLDEINFFFLFTVRHSTAPLFRLLTVDRKDSRMTLNQAFIQQKFPARLD